MDWFPEANLPNKNTKVSVGYLTPIAAPLTEMKVIFSVMTELNLKYIILEVDQAIYTKRLHAMFRMELDGSMIFDKIIPRMGGFHIVICMLKKIFSRLKDSVIIYSFMCLFFFNYCMCFTFLHCYYMHSFLGFKLSSKCFCFFKIL